MPRKVRVDIVTLGHNFGARSPLPTDAATRARPARRARPPVRAGAAAMGSHEVVVVDNGTGFLKAGYAADNVPRDTFPSIVGRPMLRAEEDAIGDVMLKVRTAEA